MGKLLKEDKIKVMEILKNLNTKYEYAQLAQYLMGSVLDRVDVEEFLETYKKDEKKSTQDLKDNLSATLTYSYKHQDRFERQLRNSYFIEYIVSQMSLQEDVAVADAKDKMVVLGKRKPE